MRGRFEQKLQLMYKYSSSLKKRATPAEEALIHILEILGLEYKFQKPFNARTFYIPDLFLKKFALIIEVDGLSHNSPEQRQRDKEKELFFQQRHIRVIRFRNEEILCNPERVKLVIKNMTDEYKLQREQAGYSLK